jgi:Tol biopolymer transport system component
MSQPLWFLKQWRFIGASSLCLLCACHFVKVDKITPTETPITADGRALTSKGENSQPAFSPDGQKITYVSSSRPQHRQPQVYEMDLKTRKERRITYQGATNLAPQYTPNGDALVYSSATDELKEDPPLLHSEKAVLTGPLRYRDPMELYLHHLTHLEIERLTKHSGFDGEARFVSNNELVFTRRTEAGPVLMQMTWPGRSATTFKGSGPRAAQLAPIMDGKRFVWIEYSDDYQTSELKIKDKKEVKTILSEISALKHDPAWTPNGEKIVFAMNYPNKTKSIIYLVKRDGSCLTKITQESENADQPTVSPTGDALLFVSNSSGRSQIYLKALTQETSCPHAPDFIPPVPETSKTLESPRLHYPETPKPNAGEPPTSLQYPVADPK